MTVICPFCRLIQSADQLNNRGFSSAVDADECGVFTSMECETDIIEDPFIAARMGKRDVGKADFERFFFGKFRPERQRVAGREREIEEISAASGSARDRARIWRDAAVISLKYEEKPETAPSASTKPETVIVPWARR